MRAIRFCALVVAALALASSVQATSITPPPVTPPLTWNFTNSSDYWVNNATINAAPVGGNAYVPPLTVDEAAVFARVNTQAPGLKLASITGGGYTISGFGATAGTPENVYGSLYLSPTGGSGSDVLVLLSPMVISGSAPGTQVYAFDLGTRADYRTWDDGLGDWTAYDPARSGTFGDVRGMLASSPEFVSFFGPQIGMESGTSGMTFSVSQIRLSNSAVPEPVTMLGMVIGVGGVGTYMCRHRKS